MIHFTCDLCGKDLTDSGVRRYVVKIAAYAGFDPNEITQEDLEDDHMEAISKLLQHDETLSSQDLDDDAYKGFRFDLCPSCHQRFIKDPLSRDLLRSLNFSEN